MTPSRPFIGQTTSPGQKNVADAMEGYYTHTTQGVLSTIFMARCSDCLLRPTSERGRKALAYSLEHVMPVPHQRGDARLLLSRESTLCPSHIKGDARLLLIHKSVISMPVPHQRGDARLSLTRHWLPGRPVQQAGLVSSAMENE